MEALEFTKDAKRMCLSHKDSCGKCGAWDWNEHVCKIDFYGEQFDLEEVVRIVEAWSKAHPIQTNADKFKEVFGQPKEFLTKSAELYLERWLAKPYEAPKGADA